MNKEELKFEENYKKDEPKIDLMVKIYSLFNIGEEGDSFKLEQLIESFETKIRIETLKEVLPEKLRMISEFETEEERKYNNAFNECRQEIINKAKDKWNIEL